ncbi:B3 domain-containing transcription factor VRN1 [Bienertia sinuspersici]
MASEDHSNECPIACFYKLLLEPRLDLEKLVIPKKFMTLHGNDLANVVYLNIPSGKVWKMELVKENGKAFLQKGWPKFVEFYSLSHGNLLVFKYQGNSRFKVIICDMSACEIDYPYDDDGDDPQSSRQSPPKKRKTTANGSNHDLSVKGKGVSTTSVVEDKIESLVMFGKHDSLSAEVRKMVEAFASAKQFKPPSFAIAIHPSAVKNKFSQAIPIEFGRRYLGNKSVACTFNFQTNKNRKSWPVTILRSDAYARLGKGWKNFALDNKINVGDICIFQLINKKQLKVAILRDGV